MLLTPEIVTLFLLNTIFVIFASIAFVLSIRILLYYDVDATTSLQYRLQKQSYLGATLIKYIFAIKIPLFLFFIFTIDKLSNVIPGAMCAAGIVDATDYGSYLFIIKILNLYLFGFWIVLHAMDSRDELCRLTHTKYLFFTFLYTTLLVEAVLEFFMLSSLDPTQLVQCCGTLYENASSSYLSVLVLFNTPWILTLFYINVFLLFIFYYLRNRYAFAFFNALFIIIALLTLIAFFCTYIYELPTHHCPFCFLQKEYYYVGYLLYGLLFLGTFFGVLVGFTAHESEKKFKLSLFFIACYTIIVSAYPLVYYIKNGVWL